MKKISKHIAIVLIAILTIQLLNFSFNQTNQKTQVYANEEYNISEDNNNLLLDFLDEITGDFIQEESNDISYPEIQNETDDSLKTYSKDEEDIFPVIELSDIKEDEELESHDEIEILLNSDRGKEELINLQANNEEDIIILNSDNKENPNSDPSPIIINSFVQLEEDTVYGDVTIEGGSVFLNGYTLTVEGNLVQNGGSLNINDGQLIIDGNYINSGSSYFEMSSDNDYMLVKGDFFMNSSYYTYMYAGTLDIKGDFTQTCIYDWGDNFMPVGSHKTVFSGDSLQTINFQTPRSKFNILEIQNHSDEGVEFKQHINANTFIDNGCVVKYPGSEYLGWTLEGNMQHDGNLYLGAGTLDLNGYNLTVTGDFIQSGGTAFINGGELLISGDYRLQTEFEDARGNKDYIHSMGGLKMVKENDYVKIDGSFINQSQKAHGGYLTDGILEVLGDFFVYGSFGHGEMEGYGHSEMEGFGEGEEEGYGGNFHALGNHKLILSGENHQKVMFEDSSSNSSCINILEITNSSTQGVEFLSNVVVAGELKDTTSNIIGSIVLGKNAIISWDTWKYDLSMEERTLDKDLTIEGRLSLYRGTLDLSGYILSVGELNLSYSNIDINGGQLEVENDFSQYGGEVNVNQGQLKILNDFNQYGGEVNINKGYLQVGRDYLMSHYTHLIMNNEDDHVLIEGDFNCNVFYNLYSYLIDGVLEVKGHFNHKKAFSWTDAPGFSASKNHKTILSGDSLQIVTFETTGVFNILEIKNYSEEGVEFRQPINANIFIDNGCVIIAPDSEPPTIPQNLELISKLYNSISFSWEESTDNVEVEGYIVYRNGWQIANVSHNEYTDIGLYTDTTYYYSVKAYDVNGNISDFSNELIVTTDPDTEAPTAPQNLTIIGRTENSVYLTWTPSTDNVGVASYRIYKNGIEVGFSRTTWYSELNIEPGTHIYTVRAYDESGNYSEESNFVLYDNMPPTIPQNLTAISVTQSTISLVWEESTDNVEVAGYRLFRDGNLIRILTETEFTDAGLIMGSTYTYTVRAYDHDGNVSEESESLVVTTATDTEPPTIPENLRLITKTNSSVTITWDESSDNIKVEGYEILLDGKTSARTTDNTYTIDRLIQNNTYTFTVKAFDEAGNYSEESQPLVVALIMPTPPQNSTGEAKEVEIVLSWEEISYDEFSHYKVIRQVNGEDPEVIFDNITTTSISDISVTPNTEYTYYIVAVDTYGNMSDYSEPIIIIPLNDETNPQIVSIKGSKLAQIYRINTAVTDNIGVVEIEFYYRKNEDPWTNFETVSLTPQRENIVYTSYDWDTKDIEDGTYEIKAIAIDGAGNESEEKIISVIVKNTPPRAPEELVVVIDQLRVDVSWSIVEDPYFNLYRIYRSTNGHDFQLLRSTILRTYTDRNVSEDGSYVYKVTAVDRFGLEGEGIFSENIGALPDTTPPVINGISPQDNSNINKVTRISVFAIDNVNLKDTEFLYSISGEDDTWESIEVTQTGTIQWNTQNLEDGTYYIKAIVRDTSLNESELIVSYNIDNTPPQVPELSGSSIELGVLLNFEGYTAPNDFKQFNIYKSTNGGEEGTFLIIGNTKQYQYKDMGADKDIENYYRVTAVDILGNESEPSNIVAVIPGKDITPPDIKRLIPENNSYIRDVFEIRAYAQDNVAVTMYSFDIKSIDGEWIPLVQIGDAGLNEVYFNFDTKEEGNDGQRLFLDGKYEIKVTAFDQEGNYSEKINTYIIANNPLSPPEHLYVKAGEWQFTVSWSPVMRWDFSHYSLYRKEGRDGQWEKILNKTTSNVYIDNMKDPQKEYFYRVSAVNDLGIESEKTHDYSEDPEVNENIDIRSLHQNSNPLIIRTTPTALSRTNNKLDLSAMVSDSVGVNILYEYAYLGESISSDLTGNETWHLIWEDTSPTKGENIDLETFLDNIPEGIQMPNIGFGEDYYISEYYWDVAHLPEGVYAVRTVAINRGNNETSLVRKYIIDREAPDSPSEPIAVDTKTGGEIQLSWQRSVAGDVDYYIIYRSTANGGPFEPIAQSKALIYRDLDVEDGTTYYYVIAALDLAGNESSKTTQVYAIPSSLSDLLVKEINTKPGLPTYEVEGEITALIENTGFARGRGTVGFFYEKDDTWHFIGSKDVEVRSMESREVSIEWTPQGTLDNNVTLKAVVTTLPCSEDIDESNNERQREFRLNSPPVANIISSSIVNSGDIIAFDGRNSLDPDGRIVAYAWDLGDGNTKNGSYITHMYQIPGEYYISLTVTDNSGVSVTKFTTVTVNDNRPDLIISDITWSPENPNEGDVINITAQIANIGNGPNSQGFLTGFYVDNKYMGYIRVDETINPGNSTEVTFTWLADHGEHIVKVVANDILDNLKEIDKDNNWKSVVLTTKQVNFPDVKVDDIRWTSGDNINLDSESPFGYIATISNIGSKRAERFFVSLYINDNWVARQHVNLLDVGESREVMFVVRPTPGINEITVKADDPTPVLLELDKDNNIKTVTTPDFNVEYPELILSPITWLPSERVLTEGTSLTFETKVKNNSSIDIRKKFNVDFIVNGETIRTIVVDGLNAGEEKELWTRWLAQPGSHKVSIIADNDGVVTDGQEVKVEADVPNIHLIYPDLNISDVTWSPLSIKYAQPVTFIARVSNQSVTSIFDNFNVALYVDGKQVAGKTVNGLRGHSTAIVDLTWRNPDKIGEVDVKIVVDNLSQLNQQPISEGVTRVWEESFNILDSLAADFYPAETESIVDAHVFSTKDNYVRVGASVKKGSEPSKLLGPDDAISAFYTLNRGGEVISSGQIGYNYVNKTFEGQIPIVTVPSGDYMLTLEAGDGVENVVSRSHIKIVLETIATIETDKKYYQHGEKVQISGYFTFRDGTPVANEKVVLNLCLNPALEEPQLVYENGQWILKRWHAETIRFINTDENGYFQFEYVPTTLGAGKWDVYAYAYELGVGAATKTDFTVWGMKTSPSELSMVASKNSNFSRFIEVHNMAKAVENLSGVSAVLVNLTPNSGVRAVMDTSTLSPVIGPEGKSGVMINFNAPLNCEDVAQYQVVFSSSEGAVATSNIKLHLRPAIPHPVTDPKGFMAGVNTGGSITRKVTVTNKGLGNMENIHLVSPQSLPWVRAINLDSNFLAPGDSTSFDIVIKPLDTTPLGQYQDVVKVTDGKYEATITFGVEVSTKNTGGLSFLIKDDGGEFVENAEVTIVGKEPYIQVIRGQEVTYYQNFYGRTDSNGIVTFEEKPIGEYSYTVRAKGRNKVDGTTYVMPMNEALLQEVIMETQPVQIEWTVVPTTIEDKYDIQLELIFGANVPQPYFGFVPPWVTVPKQIDEPVIVEATVINAGLVALTDVTAQIRRENSSDTGISIVGGGYLGEIPAHGSARISIMVQPGYYNLRRGDGGKPLNYILLQGKYVSFDQDTGLPEYPPKGIMAELPLYNPSSQKVTINIDTPEGKGTREAFLPEDDFAEVDYFYPLDGEGDGRRKDDGTDYQIVTLKLDQSATLERQAFDATLKVANGFIDSSLDNLEVRVVLTDTDGNDVTVKNFIIPTGLNGISSLDGSDSLPSGNDMSATWQLIPGEGLGGEFLEGKVYLAKAIVSYYVNGRYIETQTQPEEITIYPQPKIKLNYYVPKDIISGEPFRLGVVAENTGYGIAKNLVIDSGQLNITTNQAGLQTNFVIRETSFGSNTGNSFRLNLGDIDPQSKVSGYWLVEWVMYQEGEGAEPFEGEFREFNATLTHQDYKGVTLNPLIVGVTTEIIGKDNIYIEGEGVLSLVDVDNSGFPNYLINLSTGLKLPIHVPQSLSVEKNPDVEDATMIFNVPAKEGDPDQLGMPRYQVLMLRDPLENTPIRSVTRDIIGGETQNVTLSKNNTWKNNNHIYIVDETPIFAEKPEGYSLNQNRYYYPASYEVDFSSGAVINGIDYARKYYVLDKDYNPITKYAYYDIGVHPNEEEMTRVRALIYNEGTTSESGKVEFFATRLNSRNEEEEEIKIGEANYSNLKPFHSVYVYIDWTPQQGGNYILRSSIFGNDALDATHKENAKINFRPYADAGVDFSVNVLEPARFDGSRSYDRDGYIQSFIWEFGDGESAAGVAPVYTYRDSGTYKVKLTVIDNNYMESTSEMMITVNETRPDLRVTDIRLSNDNPDEGEKIQVYATIYNGGYSKTNSPFIVSLYDNNMFKDFVRISESINPGESKEVTFNWLNTGGVRMLTVIANDMGRPVEEADHDNNHRSRPVYTDNYFLPNLKVTEFTWEGPDEGVLDWNEEITLRAVVQNDGMANADKFNVAFMVNDRLIETKLVESLPYANGINTAIVTATWKADREGIHKFKVVADGPISHIVEADKSDNEKEIVSPFIRLRYADLIVGSVSLPNTEDILPGQPLMITVNITNQGYANVNTPFNVSVYADDKYIGSINIEEIEKNSTVSRLVGWKRPINGVETIRVIVDENFNIRETNKGNNNFEYKLTSPLTLRLPELIVEEMVTTSQNENPQYNDEMITRVVLRNIGETHINKPFTTALYVNDILAGTFRTSTVITQGSSVSGEIQWKAEYLPTEPGYVLTVYGDVYSELHLNDRNKANKTESFKVKDKLLIELEPFKDIYTVNENLDYRLKVVSTDAPIRPLGTDEGAQAYIKIYTGTFDDGNINGEEVFSSLMNYDSISGEFYKTIEENFEAGSYTVYMTVSKGEEEEGVYHSLQIVPDYLVTVSTQKQTYTVGERIKVDGKVTTDEQMLPIEDAIVTIIIVGEEEWRKDVVTNSEGNYSYNFDLPEGYGGSYSLRAEAKVNGAIKSSTREVFYVEGMYMTSVPEIEITSGYDKEFKMTLVNVGTLPITSIDINNIWDENTEHIDITIIDAVPDALEPEESLDLRVRIEVLEEAEYKTNGFKFEAQSHEGYSYTLPIEIKVLESIPEYDIIFSGNEGTVRSGEMITHVISVANTGTGSIRDLQVTSPEKLPWITVTTSGTDLILPINKGLSIRDENARAVISVNIAPDSYVRNGVYEDVITIDSNAGIKEIPVKVNVSAQNIGTIVLEVVNENYAPVEDSTVMLIGPHTSDWDQPLNEEVYIGEIIGDSLFKFENIPAGTYTLKASGEGHESVEKSIDVKALINLIPEKIVIQKEKISLGFDTSELLNYINGGLNSSERPVLKPKLNTEDGDLKLVPSFPGDEIIVKSLDGNVITSRLLTLKNFYQYGDLQDVSAEIIFNSSIMPEDAMWLNYGRVSSKSIFLGNFAEGESKRISWSFDLSLLDDEIRENILERLYFAFDADIKLTGKTQNSEGEEEAVSLDIPIKVHYLDEDFEFVFDVSLEDSVNEGEAGEIREFTYDFIGNRCKIELEHLPERIGRAGGYFGFSQDVAMVDEAFEANFTFYNPFEDRQITDVYFELQITDKALGLDGTFENGAKDATNWFVISCHNRNGIVSERTGITFPHIEERGIERLKYTIKSKANMGDISGDYYGYVFYRYTLDGVIFEGYLDGRKFTIEPPPKLYISYNLEFVMENRYELEAVVTNAGEGKAHNVTMGLPLIPGVSNIQVSGIKNYRGHYQSHSSYLEIGEVLPGETRSGTFVLNGTGFEDWANLPGLAVRSSQLNDNIVIAPMSIQEVRLNDFNNILDEVNMLECNIQNLMDKTIHDVAVVIVDMVEYFEANDEAEKFSLAMDGLSSMISFAGFLKNAFGFLGVNDATAKLTVNYPGGFVPAKLAFTEDEMRDLDQLSKEQVRIKKEVEEKNEKLKENSLSDEERNRIEKEIAELKHQYDLNYNRIKAIAGSGDIQEIVMGNLGIKDIMSVLNLANDIAQYKSNQEEARKMLNDISKFAHDKLKEGHSKSDLLNLVIEQIESRPFKITDRDRVSHLITNSSNLNEGQFDSAFHQLLEMAEEVSLEELKDRVRIELLSTKSILGTYINDRNNAPSYYPVDPIYTYLKELNNSLESMWKSINGGKISGVGNYKNIWIYHPYHGDILPLEVNLSQYREPLLESLRIQYRAYSNLSNRWELNETKARMVMIDATAFGMSFIPSASAGLMSTLVQNTMIANLKASIAQEETILKDEQRKIFVDMVGNMYETTKLASLTLSRELAIAGSVNKMFEAIDQWRKIDPPLPVEVKSMVVPDVVLGPASEAGQGKVILNIKNIYTGTLTLAPTVEIYSSKGLIDSPRGKWELVDPGETVTIEVPFIVPRSTLMDAGGYTAVVFIDIAEPETMSIGDPEGPHTAYFFAGTNEQIEARRNSFKPSQPLGRDIAPNEEDSIVINKGSNAGEIRLFMATRPGANLEIYVCDEDGNVAGMVDGIIKNDIPDVVIEGLINENDYIRIIAPKSSNYRVVVRALDGDEPTKYVLNLLEIPDLGAVPDVSYSYIVPSNTREVLFEVDVFESSLRYDVEKVTLEIGELKMEDGYTISNFSYKFIDYKGKDIGDIIPAGKGLATIGVVEIPDDAPDGIYIAELLVTVEGSNLNPALIAQTFSMSVTDGQYGWSDSFTSSVSGWEGYTYKVPLIISLNTSVPQTPVLNPISQPSENSPHRVLIKGEGEENINILIWINDILEDMIETNSEGRFELSMSLPKGTHKIHVTAANNHGTQSLPSEEYTVTVGEKEEPTLTGQKRLLEISVVGNGLVRMNGDNTSIPSNYKLSHEIGERIKLTAIADDNAQFAYWEDSSLGRMISTDPVYEFIMGTGENIKAVFLPVTTENSTEFNVVFKERSAKIIQSTNIAKFESANEPTPLKMAGYEFIRWNKDSRSVVNHLIIDPLYRRLSNEYEITVVGGTLNTGETFGRYQFDRAVEVVAEVDEGMKFSHWEQDGMKISYNENYSFFMPMRDTVLTAIYVDLTAELERTPFISLSEQVIVDPVDKTMIFIAHRNMLEGYRLIESGVLLRKSNTHVDQLTLDTPNVVRGKIHNNSTDQFYIRKTNVNEGETWYGRSYLIYEDENGDIKVTYSENIASGDL
ncbi:UNVERIFIED_CONTAM: PKD domain-containing protein [Acetivibrio alkalicellulosi]